MPVRCVKLSKYHSPVSEFCSAYQRVEFVQDTLPPPLSSIVQTNDPRNTIPTLPELLLISNANLSNLSNSSGTDKCSLTAPFPHWGFRVRDSHSRRTHSRWWSAKRMNLPPDQHNSPNRLDLRVYRLPRKRIRRKAPRR